MYKEESTYAQLFCSLYTVKSLGSFEGKFFLAGPFLRVTRAQSWKSRLRDSSGLES